ncbi:PIR Superfamily Protein [Plasmodium ovale curtisi]|uniref:PIR Superfamily Protein n=1 Tax=Plasmodium ovale curtisi TaxID=864141 RepID=A0A1A8VSA7_PLAOA|nr:PIR Superfamily Protein [Plasmodium ovale curtisi]
MNTERWKRDYPFFNVIWTLYDKFEEDVIETYYPDYDDRCKHITTNQSEHLSRYKDICKKLLRNLWFIPDEEYEGMSQDVRCTYLNMWLYYKVVRNDIPEELILKIFNVAKQMIKDLPDAKKCEYDLPFEKDFKEPEKIMKLNHFVDSFYLIEDTLEEEGEKGQNYFTCFNYIKECAKIYAELYSTYCINDTEHKFVKLCMELKTFQGKYTSEISENSEIANKIPPLTSFVSEVAVRLPRRQQAEELHSGEDDHSISHIQSSISKVGGSLVGMGTVLLLMYQFTPFGPWLRSRIGGNKGKNNHLDEEEMDHMYLNEYGNDGIYSDDIGYNMGYNAM